MVFCRSLLVAGFLTLTTIASAHPDSGSDGDGNDSDGDGHDGNDSDGDGNGSDRDGNGSGSGDGGSGGSVQEPGGFHHRRAILGGSLGLGGLSERFDVECSDCGNIAIQFAGHIGGFLGRRFAVMAELQVNTQTRSSSVDGDTTFLQAALMLAGQYWVTPKVWIKGGIGAIQLDRAFDNDGIVDQRSMPRHGVALLGAIGYEVLSLRHFSVDLQARLINGTYTRLDNNVTAVSLGVGINLF